MSTQVYQIRSGSDVGRVLRDARTERGLTQQQLVDEFGLAFDRTRLARIEAGEGFQSLDRVLSVLRRLGIDVTATVPSSASSGAEGQGADDLGDGPSTQRDVPWR
jgi:transcriptional regulator with XRE-family HTH domain